MKISGYIATSLDGFIARENGSLDWLPGSDGEIDGETEGEDYGYSAFMEPIDVMVMGRNTYELVLSFGQWPYGNKRVVVLSSNSIDIPEELVSRVEHKSGPVVKIVDEIKKTGGKHLYVDGGKTIQGFINANLLNEIIITRVPTLIGSGIPLFGELDPDRKLRHILTKSFENGFVQSKYEL